MITVAQNNFCFSPQLNRVALLAVALSAFGWNQMPSSSAIDLPITISASAAGGMQFHKSWFLSVNSEGDAVLTIDMLEPKGFKFSVSKERLRRIQKLVQTGRFSTNPMWIGRGSPDDVICSLTITRGGRTWMFTYQSVSDYSKDSETVEQIRRAYALRHEVRGWLDELNDTVEFLDMREHDRIVLGRFRTNESKSKPVSDQANVADD